MNGLIRAVRRISDSKSHGEGVLTDRAGTEQNVRIVVRLKGQNESLVWNSILQGNIRRIDFKEEDLVEVAIV